MDRLADILLEQESGKAELAELALLIDSGRHSSDYILYHPRYYARRIKEEVDKAKERFDSIRFKTAQFDTFKDFYTFSNVQEVFSDPKGVYGFASVNNGRVVGLRGTCNRANEIRYVAAKPGFGKTLFNIILANESPIMSNRDEVSQEEFESFKTIYRNPRLEKNKFQDEMGLHKKTNQDCDIYGNPILDRSYATKDDQSFAITPLLNSHKNFLYQMKNYFDKVGVDYIRIRVKEYIADAGQMFYLQERGSPGWYEPHDDIEE
jgi:hypothetical protein